jgi:membrane fusion protein, heavy metal efflux system
MLQGCGDKARDEKPKVNQKSEHETVTLTKKGINDIGLTTYTVALMPMAGELTAPAKVLPNQNLEAQVGSLVQGRVHRVFANIGDVITAGQVLMSVEGLDVGAIKADYFKAKAAYDYTATAYERQKKLYEEKAGSQKALLENQAEYEKALAEYTAEDKKIHSVGLTDDDVANGKDGREHTSGTLPVKSHISGLVVERNVIVGQHVDATTNAFKVIDTRTVWVDGQIYEKDLARIERKTKAVFTTSTYHNEVFSGRIINIGQIVDEQSRTITIRAEFSNPRNKLKPHMFGELKIPLEGNDEALLIPEESLTREADQSYVFVQTGDTTFEKRTVVTGSTVNAMIEIKMGLKENEKIAVKGVYYLKGDLKKEELSGDEN